MFKVKAKLTRPLFKIIKDAPLYVRIVGAMYQGEKLVKKDGTSASDMDPAILANVVNLETGEEGQIICNAALEAVLKRTYPNDGYIGKCFGLRRNERVTGKKYDTFGVDEIEDPAQSDSPAVAAGLAASAANATKPKVAAAK